MKVEIGRYVFDVEYDNNQRILHVRIDVLDVHKVQNDMEMPKIVTGVLDVLCNVLGIYSESYNPFTLRFSYQYFISLCITGENNDLHR